MKTSTIEVGELVSSLSAAGVARQLSALSGVHFADVNYVAGSATVHYDESRITLEAIRQGVIDCGYHCRGELVPEHLCSPMENKASESVMRGMGHAPGMSMQDMARDMRNRFLVALLFAVPVFLYSPMGKMLGDFATPYDIVGAIELSRATLRKMHQNLWWAAGCNVIAFPLAAGVFYPLARSVAQCIRCRRPGIARNVDMRLCMNCANHFTP